jgi:hypothetical protein
LPAATIGQLNWESKETATGTACGIAGSPLATVRNEKTNLAQGCLIEVAPSRLIRMLAPLLIIVLRRTPVD